MTFLIGAWFVFVVGVFLVARCRAAGRGDAR